MSERIIADAFDRWLREQGLVFRRDRMDKATTCVRGWPDFEIIEKGRVLLIEMKDGEKGRLSRDQTNLHKRFKDSGTTVYVCRDIESAVLVVQLWRSTLAEAPAVPRKNTSDPTLRLWGKTVIRVRKDEGPEQWECVRAATEHDLLTLKPV